MIASAPVGVATSSSVASRTRLARSALRSYQLSEFAALQYRTMTGHCYSVRDAARALQGIQMVGQREEIRNAVLVENVLRQDDVGAEEDIADDVAELARRMTVERDGFDDEAGDRVRSDLHEMVHGTGIGEEKIPSQSVEWVRSPEEHRRLQQRIAQERFVERRGVNSGIRPLHDGGVAAEVISVGMCGQDKADLTAELLTHRLQGFLGARVVEPGVDQDELAILDGQDTYVDAAWQDPHPVCQLLQIPQSFALFHLTNSARCRNYTGRGEGHRWSRRQSR